MERKEFSAIVFTLLLTSVLASAFVLQQARAAPGTIHIRADGSVDPPTAPISTADNVTYTFTDNMINNSFVVERDNIVVDGQGYTLQGTGAYPSRGIDLSGRTNVTIKNSQIENFSYGVWLNYSSSNSISGNNITANGYYGMWLYSSCTNNTIDGNYITNSIDAILIYASSTNNSISGNRLANNYYGVDLDSTSDNGISANNMMNNSYGIWLEDSSHNSINGNNITASKLDGMWIDSSSDNNEVSGNNVTSSGEVGMWIDSSFNNNITANIVTNSSYGIALDSSSSNSISQNSMANNKYGIQAYSFYSSPTNNNITGNNMTASSMWLETSFNNSVSGNAFTDCGLVVVNSYQNSVKDNTVNGKPLVYLENTTNSSIDSAAGQVILVTCDSMKVENLDLSRASVGVQLLETNNSIIRGNNITSNNAYGIWLESSSTNNSISENNIEDNYYGISLDQSSNNTISHNTFENNQFQAYGITSNNFWDDGYPSGGNWWSDYTGTDATGDGIGDTPYIIDINNKDRYPLMGSFSDFNATSENHVQTISNSTISNFNFNGTTITFNASGQNGAVGFCRVHIPTALMNVTYRVFVNGTEVPYRLLPSSNQTDSYVYFTYHTSTQQVTIMTELPTSTATLMALITLTIATVILKQRKPRARQKS